jgi:hypothetical protein
MQTNLPMIQNAQLPAHLAAAIANKQMAVSADALVGATTSGAVRLVANQGRFRIKEGNVETVLPDLYLDTIIVGALPGITKSYYATGYNPSDDKANKQPDCGSLFGDVPDANSPAKQCTTCAACPQNAWGSKIANGKEIKACSDYRRVAVIAADDPETIYQANIPPASIKGWTKYVKTLSQRGLDVSMVITRLSLQEHMWVFDFAGFASTEQYGAVQPLLGSSQVQDVLGTLGRTPGQAALPAPAAADMMRNVAPPLPAAAAAPAPAPTPAAPPAPPTKGFGKKGAAAPAAPPAAAAPAPAVVATGLENLAAELGALISGNADV